jgi:hypothetical protein
MRVAARRITWSLSLGLIAGGSLAAHVLAYRLVVPDPERRRHLLEASGHGYLDPAPLSSLCVTLVVVGFLARLLGGRKVGGSAPPWLFALLPPVAFGFQEHLERLIHTGAFPHTAALEATFLAGLLLQLPFALVAFVAARALLAGADALSAALRAAPPRPLAVEPALVLPAQAVLPRRSPRSRPQAPRGPPSLF